MNSKNLTAALQYQANGYSVIPVKQDKKPYMKWEEFQRRRATPEEIKKWWAKWPNAMIGVVTGSISRVSAVDVDTQEGYQAVQNYIPDSLVMPSYVTPRGGQHMLFQTPDPPLPNNTRLVPGCDFRGEGGYIIVPPSSNGQNQYQWLPGISLAEVEPPPLPDAYIEYVSFKAKEGLVGGGVGEDEKVLDFKGLQMTSGDFRKIPEGQRDHTLYHLANAILNHTISEAEVQQLLRLIAVHCCDPPFPLKEIPAKIRSVLSRIEKRERNLSQEVRDWVLTSSGFFLTSDVYNGLQLTSRSEKKACVLALLRMVEEGLTEKYGERRGCYRRVDRDCEEMDFLNASTETVDLRLPFGIHDMVEIMPGNIILVAGEVNAGKTAFLLNVVRDNMERMEVHYFNSEMGASELRKRLSLFTSPRDIREWRFRAVERSDNFADVVVSGEGCVNIIDFLELYDDFFKVGGYLAQIHKKLHGAIAIVAIQKNPGSNVGLGGFRGVEKPRLYLNMSSGKLSIVKAKNWRGRNPNGLEIKFKLVNGCKFTEQGDWYRPTEEE